MLNTFYKIVYEKTLHFTKFREKKLMPFELNYSHFLDQRNCRNKIKRQAHPQTKPLFFNRYKGNFVCDKKNYFIHE